MKIPLISGRDFLPTDVSPGVTSAPAGVAIVNELFVQVYFNGENPIGRLFGKAGGTPGELRFKIIGVVGNARYRDIREPMTPTAFVPFHSIDANGSIRPQREETFIVRTLTSNPLALASTLRREVPRARPEFRVSNIRSQEDINQGNTVRERLLARLALFFATVALLIAGVGLYGVLHYSVLQRRREIGIRMAIGAQPVSIARLVTLEVFSMVLIGAIAGIALGIASTHYIGSLLYQVKATDAPMLALPLLTIAAVTMLASMPAVIRAVRIDPVKILRCE
jgi:predicted lysophospholipase L1 biosynthesis ABC-type transport system permease subunit